MKTRTRLAAVGALSVLVVSAQGATAAAPARTVDVSAARGAGSATTFWDGGPKSGVNTSYFLDGTATKGSCESTDATTTCDRTLVHLDVPTTTTVGGKKEKAMTAVFRMEGFNQATDLDLRVYASDATGKVGTYLGSPQSDVTQTSPLGSSDPRATSAGDYETVTTTVTREAWFLVDVVYFAAANASYKGVVTVKDVPAPLPS